MCNSLVKYDESANYDKVYFIKDSLCIETYIIGYKSQGESILFFILVDGVVCFSGVVDCYCVGDINITELKLREKGISTLNFLCWTHPDLDHSKGMDRLVENYTDKNTKIWIPENVDISKATCGGKLKDFFEMLRNGVCEDRYTVYSVSDNKNLMYYESYCFKKGVETFPLKIKSYAPNSSVVRLLNYEKNFTSNLYSVFLEISLKDTNILLTGDTMDETIKQIPKRYLNKHIHILKIPHHGSESSCELYRALEQQKIDVSCATVYRLGKTSLPKDKVLKEYKKRSECLYCTGKINPGKECDKYGVVVILTDVIANKYHIEEEGNAELWNE